MKLMIPTDISDAVGLTPPVGEVAHDNDTVQRMSETWRSMSTNEIESVPHQCEYTDLADCVYNHKGWLRGPNNTGPR